ncbi:MAG: tetratricopeptide repeat protein [Spirochaetota bacterium]
MIYSQRTETGGQGQRRLIRLLVVGLGLIGVVGGVVVALYAIDAVPFGIRRRDTELVTLWNESQYDEVENRASAILSDRPLDGEALTFSGFANFYLGIELVDRSLQRERLDRCIQLLRKALHVPRAPLAVQRDYVLAKAYYHKGEEYLDLSARYMERAITGGLEAPDSRTYLGMAYARLENFESSIRWFEEAIAYSEPDEINTVRIKAAESYVELERYETARRLLEEAIADLEDDFLALMARNQLASVLLLDGRLDEAESLLEETIETYPQSADAYYYLGVVYDRTDRSVQARALWRTAREIDPSHTQSLQRLANGGG